MLCCKERFCFQRHRAIRYQFECGTIVHACHHIADIRKKHAIACKDHTRYEVTGLPNDLLALIYSMVPCRAVEAMESYWDSYVSNRLPWDVLYAVCRYEVEEQRLRIAARFKPTSSGQTAYAIFIKAMRSTGFVACETGDQCHRTITPQIMKPILRW